MAMRQLGLGCVGVEQSARDIAFGLYVGKLPRVLASARTKPNLWQRIAANEGLRRLREQLGRGTGLLLAAAMVALLTGIVLGRLESTVEPSSTPTRHQASMLKPAEHPSAQPHIAVASKIVAESASKTPLQIVIASREDPPPNGFVRVRGLPPATSLSQGHALGPGAWAIPLAGLSPLKLNVAAMASGTSKLTFTLVASGGEALAEATAVLVIRPASLSAAAALAMAARTLEPNPDRLPLRHARDGLGKLAPTAFRDAPPRVVVKSLVTRKRPVQHIAKRQQQLATKARRPTGVGTAKDLTGGLQPSVTPIGVLPPQLRWLTEGFGQARASLPELVVVRGLARPEVR